MSNSLLEVSALSCGYGTTTVLKECHFSLKEGEFVILEGENGSGKSTFLKTLLGYLKPLGGNFKWNLNATDIAYVPQDIFLDLSAPASAMDIVLTAFPLLGKKQKSAALEALKEVNLLDQKKARFGKLSGGQRRRVLFARALAQNPRAFILDEPTVNMDKETEAMLGKLIHKLVTKEKKAVIATSHVTEWVSHSRKCFIKEGQLHG